MVDLPERMNNADRMTFPTFDTLIYDIANDRCSSIILYGVM